MSSDDLRKVWHVCDEIEARNPGQGSIGSTVYESVCSPGADVTAVWYRVAMLGLITRTMPELLAQWTYDGQLDDGVSEVAATFPMKRMRTGWCMTAHRLM